jgi:serine/threonine protein kinase/biopolymer transport protein ExbD
MGEVYLVENVEMGKRYALKLLPGELARDDEFRERFRREARVMADLSHPNIVGVHHMAEEAGQYFLVMDYIKGLNEGPHTLADALFQREKLPEAEARRIALEIASALGAAHSRGVVHRDIKPGNILLDAEARVRVSDFGLARVVGDEFMKSLGKISMSLSAALTEGGAQSASEKAVIGTWAYMSPEQKAGRPADARSDTYALGLVIYRMLTGRRAEGAFDTPSELGCSKSWDGIVRKCLRQRPMDRYQSAADLTRDIEGDGRSGAWKPIALGAAALVLAAAAVLGLWYAVASYHQEPQPQPGPHVSLPTLDNLGLKEFGPPDDGPSGVRKWLRKVTVTIPAEGKPQVTGATDASRWRSNARPYHSDYQSVPEFFEQRTEIRVRIYWANDEGQMIHSAKMGFPPNWSGQRPALSVAGAHIMIEVNNLPTPQTRVGDADLDELTRVLKNLVARNPLPVTIDAREAVPFRWVMGVIASCSRANMGLVIFQAPDMDGGGPPVDAVIAARLKEEAGRAKRDTQGLPNVCVRIRADASAPYIAIQGAMMAAMRSRIWRLSLVGVIGGREVEIGMVRHDPSLPFEME